MSEFHTFQRPDVGKLGPQRLQGLGPRSGEDDQVRPRDGGGACNLFDRGIGPQVIDPPAVVVEHDAEDHERQVMLLAGWAGEQGLWPVPAAPAPGQPGEPAADDVASEMLHGYASCPALPALAEVGEIGQHHIA